VLVITNTGVFFMKAGHEPLDQSGFAHTGKPGKT